MNVPLTDAKRAETENRAMPLVGDPDGLTHMQELVVCANMTMMYAMVDILDCIEHTYKTGQPGDGRLTKIHVHCDHLKMSIDKIRDTYMHAQKAGNATPAPTVCKQKGQI